ncbi:MAG: CARDB domain-containing protein [Methylobacter sp.]|uniref:CARDB domain-containing protein n=1 Tax=Methylobacter sp. TaxID=2051955 RepID=UPI002732225C|nr:CARDB domain-containing protein [Methylobacter sp.]MDP1667162.1 CARDB domain-containing protein [Methylobacter sp.]
MRKSTKKEDRSVQSPNFKMSLLMSALKKALRTPNGQSKPFSDSAANKAKKPTANSAIRFEALEPRVLLSGDLNPAQTVSGSIDVQGEVDQYGFTLTQNTQIVFDSLTDNSNMNWSLSGPDGAVVGNRRFTNSDSAYASASPLLNLAVGDYTLTVDANTDQIGAYSFRLIDVLKAQEIAPGTNVEGTLDLANQTNVYKFNATAGDHYYFNSLNLTGENPYWRLIDPNGNNVFGPSYFTSDADITTAVDGSYTLLVEGLISATGSSNYSFNVQKVTDDQSALTLGDTVNGSIAHAGQRDFYNFSLGEAKQLYFDALSNTATNWILIGPRGAVVSAMDFTKSDSNYPNGSAIYDLVAGDYTLIIDGNADMVGNYSFRLLDIAQATPVTPGTVVNGQLSPANETDLYQFNVTAGDQYVFDSQSLSNGAVWRLLDPYGQLVFGHNYMGSDIGSITLTQTGTYTLLTEGYIGSTDTTNYQFNVVYQGNTPIAPLPTGTALTLGTTVAGVLPSTQTDFYSFTLDSDASVYFDALSNNSSLTWTLTGPRGTVVSARSFTDSDSINLGGVAAIPLVAGTYSLRINGPASWGYSFRVLNIAQAAPLTPGTVVSGQLSPANETDLYQFAVTAGERFYFDYKSASGPIYYTYWRLLDPYGQVVFGPDYFSLDKEPLTLMQTGAYTLLVEGWINNVSTTNNYSFTVQKVTDEQFPLTVGDTVTGSIAHAGQRDFYNFSLSEAKQLYFDALSNTATNWTLIGPRGAVVSALDFTKSDSNYPNGSAIYDLVAGDYTLIIDGNADMVGNYSFRLLDIAQATPLTPGTVVSGQLSPANETDLYQFNVTAGERFYFNYISISATNYWPYWRLLDPNGQLVFGPGSFGSDKEPQTLTQTGVYTLLIEGNVSNTGTANNYSFAVQKVTDEQFPLTVGDTVTGSIAHAGQRDFYSFSLSEAKQLYFDALAGTHTNWTLVGPRGTVVFERPLGNTDSGTFTGASAIYDLVAGDYTLIIDGYRDLVGNYSFRLLDIAQATPLTPGTTVSGQLSPVNETDLYQFAVMAGERFYFDYQSFSGNWSYRPYWRLVDPYGQLAFGPDTLEIEKGPLTLMQTGAYTLLIEGRVTNPEISTNYSFVVQKITDEQYPLTVGNTVTGSIAHAGQRDFYNFSLSEAKQLYFDSLTNNSSFNWTLIGPQGTIVSALDFTKSDSNYPSGSAIYDLVAGDYTLIIDSNADMVGNYSFRVLDIAQATALMPGTVVSSELSPANETDLYQFNVTAGERFYFSYKSFSGSASPFWRLVDTYGQLVFGPEGFSTQKGPLTLTQTGAYTLLIEGWVKDTGALSNYSFAVQKVTDEQYPLTVGNTVNGSIAHAGQRDFYNFSLSEAKQLYFDSLTNNNSVNWTLIGPRGKVVSGLNFGSTDSSSFTGGSAIYDLVAGDYTLIIDGNADMVGNYSFRLLDIAQATLVTPGTPATGQFTPANETDLYRFNVTVGDRYIFDSQSLSNGAYWRLLDPYGQLVFGPQYMGSDIGSTILTQTGIYTLLAEGLIYATGTTNYQFNVVYQGNTPIAPLPTGTALTLGTTVAGVLPSAQTDFYSFTLDSDASVYFDALSNNSSLTWALTGPRGTVVSARSFVNSDSINLGGAATIPLVAGTYSLRINGPAANGYSFRLLNLAQATALTPGTVVNGQLSPVNETDLYQFNVMDGERFYFDYKSYSGGLYYYRPNWWLLDPNGQLVFGPESFGADKEPLTLTQTGAYTLLIEGRINNIGETSNYSFNVQKVTDEQSTLTVGDIVTGSIAHAGQRDFYSFSLGEAKQLYFDALTSTATNWTLAGPKGTIVSGRNFANTDSDGLTGASAIYDLVAGDYTLIIDGNADMVGNYSFRLLDIAQATPLTPGTPVDGQLSPANETDLYQFNVTAGERFYFDYKSSSGGSYWPYWRLVAPNGQLVFGPDVLYNEKEPLTLTQTGAYTLLIEGHVYYDTEASNYSFNVQKVTDEQSTLTVGDTVNGSIAHAGQRDFYSFSLSEAKQLYFDSLSNNNSFNWTLIGPRGTVVSAMDFTRSDSEYRSGSAIYDLAAGDYTLIVDSYGDKVGDYSFRLLDIVQATSITPGTVISGQLNPANETDIYRFNATAGDQYYFDSQALSNAAYWRLLDPYGQVVFDVRYMGSDTGPIVLAQTGVYTLLIEGLIETSGTTNYKFSAVEVPKIAKIIITGLGSEPGPDLIVRNLAVAPVETQLKSGGQVVLSWETFNTGDQATESAWQDRVIVRNVSTNEIIANYLVNYDDIGTSPLQAGAGRNRQITMTLPEGYRGAGDLSFQVTADVANNVTETGINGEQNNAAITTIQSTLSAYPDLKLGSLSVEPPGAWAPGTAVTMNWRVSNTGDADITKAWKDHLQVRNLSTGQLVASADLPYLPSVDGTLAAGGFIDRAYTLTWPTGINAAGQFEFVLSTDYNADIFENNLQDTAETNNTGIVTIASGPDLLVKNLHTEQIEIYAGGLITLAWETWNEGQAVTPAGFNERIIITNKTTGEQLLNTSIAYDITQAGAGVIASGEFRNRSFNFRLPDGLRGVGEIEIRVVTNQNGAGQSALFETNAANTAGSNNSASIQEQSSAVPYADLQAANFTAPVDGVAGEAINVSWSVANNGDLDTPAAWNDQIVFSTDSIIGNSDDVVIGTYRHNGALKAGESYTKSVSVNLPYKPAGRYYLAVKSDSGLEVLEPDTRADNTSLVSAIDVQTPYADLTVVNVTAPESALSGENILITWEVNNNGNAKTDLALWNDRVVLSSDASLSNDDIILSGSITHAGQIAAGQGYLGKAILTLPRDLVGDYYVLVDTNTNRTVTENGYTANNVGVSITKLSVSLAPVADLTVSDVTGPLALRPGEQATVSYAIANLGNTAAAGPWRDRIYLDTGADGLQEVANSFYLDTLQAGASETRTVTFTLPAGFAEGDFHWVVKTDTDNTIYERTAENNNAASSTATVHVARIDLAVTGLTGPSLVESGSTVHLEWSVVNNGSNALGSWVDQVFLSKNGVLTKVAEIARNGQLATAETYTAAADFLIPIELNGEYELVVVADAKAAFDDRLQDNNRLSSALTIDLAAYADLTVTEILAPTQVIDDPAPVDITWTVANQGTGVGQTAAWTDRVVLSKDSTFGNWDDLSSGNFSMTARWHPENHTAVANGCC